MMNLLKLIDARDNEQVKSYMLKKGPSLIDAKFSDFYVLTYAVLQGQEEIVECLLEYGCRVNKTGNMATNSPLHIAVKNRNIRMVLMLLNKGASVLKANSAGETPIHFAAKSNNIVIMDLILRRSGLIRFHIACILGATSLVDQCLRSGAAVNESLPVDFKCFPGYTPLHLAVEFGRLEVVQRLLREGADLSIRNSKGLTAINLAAQLSHMNIVDYILKAHEQPNQLLNPIDDQNFSPFHAACMLNDPIRIAQFLQRGVDINSQLSIDSAWPGFAPLHLVTKHCSVQAVKLLLDHGADVYQKNSQGETPLLIAAKEISKPVIKALLLNLANRSDISNLVNAYGLSHFHVACMHADPSIVLRFLEWGAEVNQPVGADSPDWPLCTPLHFALQGKCEVTVRLLMRRGANVKVADAVGTTPLHLATRDMDEELVKSFLERGAQVDALTETGTTALHLAARRGNYRIVRLLIRHGARVNRVEKTDLSTPLHHALVNFKCERIVRLLLKRGANIKAADASGTTPVQLAAELMNAQVLWLFLNHGADPNTRCRHGWTMLHFAVEFSCRQSVRMLLDRGADVHAMDELQRVTPIQLAARKMNRDVLSVLLEKNIGVEAFTSRNTNETLLHRAAHCGNYLLVRRLIQYKAEVNCATRNLLQTPLHFAVTSRCKRTVELLLDHGADVNAVDVESMTPLHLGVRMYVHSDLLELLLERGAVVDARNDNGETPLHLAAEYGNLEHVKVLIRYKADINYPVGDMSPLLLAASEGNIKVTKLLMMSGADPNKQTEDGKNVFHLLMRESHNMNFDKELAEKYDTIVKLFVDVGCDLDAKDRQGYTALYYSKPTTAYALLINGADINLQSSAMFIPASICLQEMFEKQLKKMSVLNRFLKDSEPTTESSNSEDSIFAQSCVDELNRMRATLIDQYSTLYSMLFKNSTEMASHVLNSSFVEMVRSENFDATFPMYGYIIKLQLRKGLAREVLLEPAKVALEKVLNMSLPDPCLESIIKNLTNNQLKHFIRTCANIGMPVLH